MTSEWLKTPEVQKLLDDIRQILEEGEQDGSVCFYPIGDPYPTETASISERPSKGRERVASETNGTASPTNVNPLDRCN
jgi:hypothetical protein